MPEAEAFLLHLWKNNTPNHWLAYALGRCGTPACLEQLATFLRSNPDPLSRTTRVATLFLEGGFEVGSYRLVQLRRELAASTCKELRVQIIMPAIGARFKPWEMLVFPPVPDDVVLPRITDLQAGLKLK